MQEAWQITANLLQRMQQVTESQQARLMVMVIPTAANVAAGPRPKRLDPEHEGQPRTVTAGFEHPERSLTDIGNELGVPVINLLPALRRQAGRSNARLYFRVNAHWTPAGHALAADALATALQRSGMLR